MKRYHYLPLVLVLLLIGLAGCSLFDGCATQTLTAEQSMRVTAGALSDAVVAAHEAYGNVYAAMDADDRVWMTANVGGKVDAARDAAIAFTVLAELNTSYDQWRTAKAKALAENAAIPPLGDYIGPEKIKEAILVVATTVGKAPSGEGEDLVSALLVQGDVIYALAVGLLTEVWAAVDKAKAADKAV